MGWIRVSDDFCDNEKMIDVGPLGVALHHAALGFCNRNLTDGYFRKSKARLFLDFEGICITTARGELCGTAAEGDDAAALVIEWMVAADLWHEAGHDCVKCHSRDDGGEPSRGEFLVHDYFEFQPSKAEIEAKAEANRKRVEAWRAKNAAGKAATNEVSNNVGNGVGNALRTEHVQPTPNPTPTPTVISNEITNGGGYVSAEGHQEPPSRCPSHVNHPNPPKCGACADARRAHQAWEDARQADELAARRQLREAADNCPICGGTNWIHGPDGKPLEPAVKCNHQEAVNE